KVPTFIVGGTYDIFQRGEPILFRALPLSGARKKLLIGPWYHTTAGDGLTPDAGSSPVLDTQGNLVPSLNNLPPAWFDRWLKGVQNGIDAFPTVETYYLGAGKWVPDKQYPASRLAYQRWYLSATPGTGTSLFAGSLASAADLGNASVTLPWIPVDGTCTRSTTQWTAGLVSGTTCENDDRPSELLSATFTTPPFTAPYAIAGPIDATIWVSSTATDAQVITTISDVDPTGASSEITAGTLVASLRALTTTGCGSIVVDCSLYGNGQLIEPWHPYTRLSQTPLTPAVIRIAPRLRLRVRGRTPARTGAPPPPPVSAPPPPGRAAAARARDLPDDRRDRAGARIPGHDLDWRLPPRDLDPFHDGRL